MSRHTGYIGRFAPSPSGSLHFGSLLAALASYLDARANNGSWLVRMEDIDTPRCVKGADSDILHTLERYGFEWDGEVMYQSHQHERYRHAVEALLARESAYYCTCTRKMIKDAGGAYPGTCRYASRPPENAAVRAKLVTPRNHVSDRIQGDIVIDDPHALEDPVIKRRDGLFAYNLVVVMDDAYQNVTHIVRGNDLLTTTATQQSLYALLEYPAPTYAHIPVASVTPGRKLSKQNHAAPLSQDRIVPTLLSAMSLLGLPVSQAPQDGNIERLLSWAIAEWNVNFVPKRSEIIVDRYQSTYYSDPQVTAE
ncbi:tRNA glutamyl-Q(34) synthetase GluQRS [Alteromonas antoniana]|uniref:tRNA glutamyl-Q(34) synthetase GluQRS n=1 Tax=Alteromonas antoniana TaxID=2803813 RepID=UPI001C4740A8|nr:tRNA glutamyl-Q(34) synthetase GluQRS [Alteromonas antoniana]